MNGAADPLAELRPLHLPPEIGWWPPAPGWWILALLLLVLVMASIWWWRRGRARREALRILRSIERAGLSGPPLAQAVNVLLRRYAMACYPQRNAGALAGQSWLEFLQRHGAGRDYTAATALTTAAFAQDAQVDRHELIALARHWVRHNAHNAKEAAR